jgi:hypothetical protein
MDHGAGFTQAAFACIRSDLHPGALAASPIDMKSVNGGNLHLDPSCVRGCPYLPSLIQSASVV